MLLEFFGLVVAAVATIIFFLSVVACPVTFIIGVVGVINASLGHSSGRNMFRFGYAAWLLGPATI